jgi:uncharacterized protein
LVAATSVGRLCFMDRALPIAHPVSFKLLRDDQSTRVVVRTSERSLIAAAAGPASFEVDDIDALSRAAWSVLLRGNLRRVHDPVDLPAPEPWITDGPHVSMVLDVVSISGRRFVAHPIDNTFVVEWALDRSDQGPMA